jgi:hypothetical protein
MMDSSKRQDGIGGSRLFLSVSAAPIDFIGQEDLPLSFPHKTKSYQISIACAACMP